MNLLTLKEAAEKIRVGYSTIYRLVAQEGQIPHVRIGKKILVKETDLEDFIKSSTTKVVPCVPAGVTRFKYIPGMKVV
ncbi:MAG: helix-turn-helix domain-containing protein [Oscillospiraceae bacterium]|nr:helix-turn-helix domain-containing protein [Oscillospiraceae bacterium]